jgi:hypothetical protein
LNWPKLSGLLDRVFYAYEEDAFYQLSISVTGVRTIVSVSSWIARTGRQSLYFQYRHNSPLTNRIDPGTTNIIDLYVVTLSYYTAYQNWLRDTTGTVIEPDMPTIDELTTEYQNLQDYKMISDNIVSIQWCSNPCLDPRQHSSCEPLSKSFVRKIQQPVPVKSKVLCWQK